ncbi:MAG: macro domain-containing protein [FCB group bacterium]|nr:macro domain-containing protein [FCB group bacterium]
MKERILIVEGDLTELDADAIVNAANNELILGSGVAGAISRRGGASIQEECDQLGPIKIGEAAVTRGGNLKADWVIHAASMGFTTPTTPDSLRSSTVASLKIAQDKYLNSVAFPALGTGVSGFSMRGCAEIMLRETLDFLEVNEYPETVIFCLYGDKAKRIFEETLRNML